MQKFTCKQPSNYIFKKLLLKFNWWNSIKNDAIICFVSIIECTLVILCWIYTYDFIMGDIFLDNNQQTSVDYFLNYCLLFLFRIDDRVQQCRIYQSSSGFGFLKSSTPFKTLDELVRTYHRASLEPHNPCLKTTLKYPVGMRKEECEEYLKASSQFTTTWDTT